jgi:hypothetical protein
MSRWLPGVIQGPLHNPIADVRWNAAEVRIDSGGPAEAVLLSASALNGAEPIYIVGYNVLPEGRSLILDVHLRTDARGRDVSLQRVVLPTPSGGEARVFLYAVTVIGDRPMPARAEPAVATPQRAEAQRDFDALPSMY